eukprot:c21966_g1_i2 orf=1034-1678(+)
MTDRYVRRGASPDSSYHSEEEFGGHHGYRPDLSSLKEQDRILPIANVGRIMKRALPSNAKISKEAKETVQECVSEFISFITGEASDKCRREKRKTINGDDLLWAMSTLGFEEYLEPLKFYLAKYRETEGEKVSLAKQGDQVMPNEGSSAGLPLAHFGMNDSLGGGEGTTTMWQQSYGQQSRSLMYSQHQLPAPYQFSYSRGGATDHSGGWSRGS